MKKFFWILILGFVLAFTSCGDQHKAQSLVKDFMSENLEEGNDCSFDRFSRLTPTAMISFDQVKMMRSHMGKLSYIKKNIDYKDGAYPDTLLYIRATYDLTSPAGSKQQVTQTFYMDKALTRVIAFKEN